MAYKTRQGEALIEYLKTLGSKGATVAEIAAYMSGTIGVTTIYRRLDKLAEQGLVRKCSSDGEAACYRYIGDRDCSKHFHLICVECGQMIHLECEQFNELAQHIYEEHGFLTDPIRSSLYGVCSCCTHYGGTEGEKNRTQA